MPNYGSTSINVTGPEPDRQALRDALAATASGTLAFSLVHMAPEVWRGDGLLRNAEITQAGDVLQLYLCMAYDMDCLALAESLSHRYPTLHFDGWFDCEGSWPEFTVSAYAGGVEIYHALFEATSIASVITEPYKPNHYHAILFYLRTPERMLAAAAMLKDRLEVFVRRPAVVAEWRRSDDSPASTVYFLPDADEAGHLVLALDMHQSSAILLRDVDASGGYRDAETLPLGEVRVRFPELIDELDRLGLTVTVERNDWLAQYPAGVVLDDDAEIPF